MGNFTPNKQDDELGLCAAFQRSPHAIPHLHTHLQQLNRRTQHNLQQKSFFLIYKWLLNPELISQFTLKNHLMEAAPSYCKKFNLIVESCKYDEGALPQEAFHAFSKKGDNEYWVDVYWKEANGTTHNAGYRLIADGKPHDEVCNNDKLVITTTKDGEKLKINIVNVRYESTYEIDGQTKKMELWMKEQKGDKWINYYQTYVAA